MHVGRKSAFVLLVVAVLWIAAPAFACLMPAAKASCCHGMHMQECASAAAMPCSYCCKVQPADALQAPVAVRVTEHAAGPMLNAGPAMLVSAPPKILFLRSLEAPPPLGSPGATSVLRI